MADAVDGGGGSVYLCCHCKNDLGSKKALRQHMKVCAKASDTSWIKKEPEEGDPASALPGKPVSSTEGSCAVETGDEKQVPSDSMCSFEANNVTSDGVTFKSDVETIAIKSAKKRSQYSETTVNTSTVGDIKIQTRQFVGVPTSSWLSQTNTSGVDVNTEVDQSSVSSPQTFKVSPSQQVAKGAQTLHCKVGKQPQTLQSSSVQVGSHPTSSVTYPVSLASRYHDTKGKLTALDLVNQGKVLKKPETPSISKSKTLFILPKTSENTVNTNSNDADASVPKIDSVYYTHKKNSERVGKIRLACEPFHPPPQTEEFNEALSHKKRVSKELMAMERQILTISSPVIPAAPLVQSQSQIGSNVFTTVAQQQQQTPLQTFQTSQLLQHVSQNAQQMGQTVLNPTLGLSQLPQSLVPHSQTLLQNQPSILQNSQSLIGQPQILSNNSGIVLYQPGVQNVMKPPIMPIFTSQQISVQPPAVNLLPTHSPSIPLSPGTANTLVPPAVSLPSFGSPTSTATLSSSLPVGGNKISSSITSPVQTGVQQSKPVVPGALPVVTNPQMPKGINPAYFSAQTRTVLQNPSGCNIILLPSGSSQTLNQFQQPVTTSPLLTGIQIPSSLPAGMNTAVSASVQQQQGLAANPTKHGFILLQRNPGSHALQNCAPTSGINISTNLVQQNQVSNVGMLQPALPQGYILNGIRIDLAPLTPSSNENVSSDGQKQAARATVQRSATDSCLKASTHSTASTSTRTCISDGLRRKRHLNLVEMATATCDKLKRLAPKGNEGTCSTSRERDTIGRQSLILTFNVKGNAAGSGIKMLSEYKVGEIAKMLLTGKIKKLTPVVLDDGRPFLPITYTGPFNAKYIRKQVSSGVQKNEFAGNMQNNTNSDRASPAGGVSENKDNLVQETVQISGSVVWLFLDFDEPKVLWRVIRTCVVSVPLESELPPQVLTEVGQLLSRYRLTLPACINPFPVLAPVIGKEKETSANLFFKEEPESSNWQHIRLQPPPLIAGHASVLPESLKVKSNSSVLDTGASVDCDVAEFEVSKQGYMPRATRVDPKQEPGNQTAKLIVKESASVIQRALEAVVSLERIAFTETSVSQKPLRISLDGTEDDGDKQTLESDVSSNAQCSLPKLKRRGRKPCWLEMYDENEADDEMPELTPEDVLVKKEPEVQLDRRSDSRSNLMLESDLSDEKEQNKDEETEESMDTQDSTGPQSVQNAQSERSESKDPGSHLPGKSDVETDINSGTKTEQRFRILCKPEPKTKSKKIPQDKLKTKGHEQSESQACDQHKSKKRKHPSSVIKPKSSPRTDIYTHSQQSFQYQQYFQYATYENDGTRVESVGNYNERMKTYEEQSLPTDVFLSLHAIDFKELILKKSKTSDEGVAGHVLYLCVICGSFQSRSTEELAIHLRQHHSGELSCKFKLCKFSAAHRQELIEHEALEHTGKPLYHCHVCKTPFFSQAVFQSHVKRHQNNTECKKCHKNFPNEVALRMHQEKEHSTKILCRLCSIVMPNLEALRAHYRYCIDGYQCCLCWVKERTVEDLQLHMKNEHRHKGTLYVCSFDRCGACFLSVEELGSHTSMHVNSMG